MPFCVFFYLGIYISITAKAIYVKHCIQLNYITCLRDDVRAATIVHFSYGNFPTKIIKFWFKIYIIKFFFFYLLLLLCKLVCSNASKWYFLFTGREDSVKRQPNRSMFLLSGPKLLQANHFNVLLDRFMTPEPNSAHSTDLDQNSPSTSELSYLDFFGDNTAMQRLLLVEGLFIIVIPIIPYKNLVIWMVFLYVE